MSVGPWGSGKVVPGTIEIGLFSPSPVRGNAGPSDQKVNHGPGLSLYWLEV